MQMMLEILYFAIQLYKKHVSYFKRFAICECECECECYNNNVELKTEEMYEKMHRVIWSRCSTCVYHHMCVSESGSELRGYTSHYS